MLGGVKLLNIDSCTDLNGKFQSQKSSMLRKYKTKLCQTHTQLYYLCAPDQKRLSENMSMTS